VKTVISLMDYYTSNCNGWQYKMSFLSDLGEKRDLTNQFPFVKENVWADDENFHLRVSFIDGKFVC